MTAGKHEITRVISDGFVFEQSPEAINFAEVTKTTDGGFDFKTGQIDGQFCHYLAGDQCETLEGALDKLDEWEKNTAALKPARKPSSQIIVLRAENFRKAAREMGIPVGPEERSHHHAAKAKRAFLKRYKMMRPV